MPKIINENQDLVSPATILDNDTIQLEFGVDGNDSDLVKLSVQSSGGATFGNPMVTLDSSANGNVIITPNGSGTLQVDSLGAGTVMSDASGNLSVGTVSTFEWSVETGASVNMVAGMGYFSNRTGAALTLTLPATAAVGDIFQVAQMDATGSWTIAQNAGQTIYLGNTNTTTGAGGSLSSTDTGDWVELVCRVANTEFQVNVKQGNPDVV